MFSTDTCKKACQEQIWVYSSRERKPVKALLHNASKFILLGMWQSWSDLY